MNPIEEQLRDAFGAHAETVRPHPGAHAENARRIRRARARRMITLPTAGVALATAAVTLAPVALPGFRDDAPVGAAGAFPGALVKQSTIVRIPAGLPGGAAFTADTVGADGTVLGRSADSRVWRAGARGGTPRPLGVRAQGGLTAGPGHVTWIEPGKWELKCRTPDGATRVIGPQGATAERPVLASGGAIIGSDIMEQPFVTGGCASPGRVMDTRGKGSLGLAVALSYPTAFVTDLHSDRVVREVDVRTDKVIREHPLPAGVKPQAIGGNLQGGSGQVIVEAPASYPFKVRGGARKGASTQKKVRMQVLGPEKAIVEQRWQAAANDRYFAWAVDGVLRIVDREDWKRTITPLRGRTFSPAQAALGRLTAGDRVIAYTAAGRSVVYDTRTRVAATYQGEVYAAGDWLLWRAGNDYRLARVR
ncbi:hypothetical protein [Actinomadura rubrisoli]|uniref:Uncharacterized protein n=1 Tax=Actinomadura rubrisoli TaxID=2530368 RepID=A0A4R5BAE4_9ACTN|nr:hypothetical protein [Actinomadura rubrisoli]TDD83031.1 hypothetical protein E1298_21840 [Actinomadura rubrisoli]